jgi:hypothetical protein
MFHRPPRHLAIGLNFSGAIANVSCTFAASRQNCFAFAPEGLHLERHFATNKPAYPFGALVISLQLFAWSIFAQCMYKLN